LSITFLNIISCHSSNDEKIIPRDEFVKIITDLHYADALITNRGFEGFTIVDSVPSYYKYIMKKYNVTQKSFDYSFSHYADNMDDFLAIYDEVIKNITNKIPKKLNDKSIYNILDLALEEARIKADPAAWYGPFGRVMWSDSRTLIILNKDSLKNVEFTCKIKYPCLLLLKTELLLEPEDSSKNLRMFAKVNYKDSTFDISEKPIKVKKGKWEILQLFLKTDSTKTAKSVECNFFKTDSLKGTKHGMIKNIFLTLYPHYKDSNILKIKSPPLKKK
jgi:hypothetical protein